VLGGCPNPNPDLNPIPSLSPNPSVTSADPQFAGPLFTIVLQETRKYTRIYWELTKRL